MDKDSKFVLKMVVIFFPFVIALYIWLSSLDHLNDGIHSGIISGRKFDASVLAGRIISFINYKGEIGMRITSIQEQVRFICYMNNSYFYRNYWSPEGCMYAGDSIYKAANEDSLHLFQKDGKYSWKLYKISKVE